MGVLIKAMKLGGYGSYALFPKSVSVDLENKLLNLFDLKAKKSAHHILMEGKCCKMSSECPIIHSITLSSMNIVPDIMS